MKAAAIATMNLSRLLRDKTAIFFVFVFPMLVILALGATFGQSFVPKVGVLSEGEGPLAQDLVALLEDRDGLDVMRYEDADRMRDDVERGRLEGAVTISADYDEMIRSGGTAEVGFTARPTGSGQELRLTVAEIVDAQGVVVGAARLGTRAGGLPWDEAMRRAEAASGAVERTTVRERVAGTDEAGYSFAVGAAQELILFMFVTSLSASSMLIESRRLGCSRRMLASPTPVSQILLGESLGRYLIALLQGFLIVAGTMIFFQVGWGGLGGTTLTVALFAATATGAAMLMGSVLKNEQQAGGLGVFLGLALAALGGAMVPLEIFPPVMAFIAHLTPHAWAIEALTAVQAGSSVTEIAPELTVLAVFAFVLIAVATVLLRRTITAARAG